MLLQNPINNRFTLLFALFVCCLVSTFWLQGEAAPRSNSDFVQELLLKSKQCLGREMWKPGYGLTKGTLGCAAAVCNVLKASGNSSVHSAVVTVMRRQLLAPPNSCREFVVRNGEGRAIDDGVLLRCCQPGDILLGFKAPPSALNGGANAHCGIMGQGTQVFTNNWMDGIWTEVEIHQMFDYYPYIRLLRFSGVESKKNVVNSNK